MHRPNTYIIIFFKSSLMSTFDNCSSGFFNATSLHIVLSEVYCKCVKGIYHGHDKEWVPLKAMNEPSKKRIKITSKTPRILIISNCCLPHKSCTSNSLTSNGIIKFRWHLRKILTHYGISKHNPVYFKLLLNQLFSLLMVT